MKTTKELIIADITAKVEAKLAIQKVELGLAQDMIKSHDLVLSSLLGLSDKLDSILKAENSASEIRNGLMKQYTQFTNVEDEVKKAHKELGLDYSASKYAPDNQKLRDRMQQVMTNYSKIISKI